MDWSNQKSMINNKRKNLKFRFYIPKPDSISFIIYSALCLFITLNLTFPVYGFVMESTGYKIQSDTINIGGLRSESTSYVEESTVGEVATGPSDSTNYSLKAGYQQMQEVYLAITAVNDVTMFPSLGGISGGTSNGETQVIVTTDNSAGFNVTIESDSDNGMEGETTTGVIPILLESDAYIPDYDFTTAPVNSAAFAYTINASTTGQIVQAFRNNGADTCGTGTTETDDNCWIAATTTARTIINTSSETSASGATSTLKYRVIISANPAPLIPEDVYTSTTTLTAVAN